MRGQRQQRLLVTLTRLFDNGTIAILPCVSRIIAEYAVPQFDGQYVRSVRYDEGRELIAMGCCPIRHQPSQPPLGQRPVDRYGSWRANTRSAAATPTR